MANLDKFMGCRWPTAKLSAMDDVLPYVRRKIGRPKAGRSSVLRYCFNIGLRIVLARKEAAETERRELEP